jgi:hypothetical protein
VPLFGRVSLRTSDLDFIRHTITFQPLEKARSAVAELIASTAFAL